MKEITKAHSFHIPVMGIGFTIDTPLKVAPYGIDSAISLVDDILLEKLREVYCQRYGLTFSKITSRSEDHRAKRITAYLNTIHQIVKKKTAEIQDLNTDDCRGIHKYLRMLPDTSKLKEIALKLIQESHNFKEAQPWLTDHLPTGSIDVNIMTKVDKENYRNGEKLPLKYNDAHAAVRGFALSEPESSLILSAGMNPKLYTYLGNFDCFFPDQDGYIKKRIILKVSDFRSALIQGKFLAKRGLWVSEYRIESGLNCGGHTFATNGHLLGPILSQFRDRREELVSFHTILNNALSKMQRTVPAKKLPLRISAQGGIGTSEEHRFIIDHYQVDSVGWGTPFLLVPEVTTVDAATINKLADAKEEDLYLSDISPLGVPFNNLGGNTKDIEKYDHIEKGRPGSSCPKKYVSINKEFTNKGICPASRQYQSLKLKELDQKPISSDQYQIEYEKIVEKSCICVGLGTTVLLKNNLSTKKEGDGVSICPGPNMAYFSEKMSLEEIMDHIYGRSNVIHRKDRPNVFIKELGLYINFLKNKIFISKTPMIAKQKKQLVIFSSNLREGIIYYQRLFHDLDVSFKDRKSEILRALDLYRKKLDLLDLEIENLSAAVAH